ncbi:hypothetical protein [Streptomyces sp. NPDC055287]
MIERYKPQFSHKDWIDNQDRVQAGGRDGLNHRFHLLENEFAGLAENQINPIIDSRASTTHLTLTPALMRCISAGGEVPPWFQGIDMVEKPPGIEQAHGFMNIVLPDGALVRSLLATGNNNSSKGTLHVSLVARNINKAGGGTDFCIQSTTLGTAARPEAEVKILNDTHRYYVTVDLDGADAASTVQVFCVQLSYQ